jgi:hypothetical protein
MTVGPRHSSGISSLVRTVGMVALMGLAGGCFVGITAALAGARSNAETLTGPGRAALPEVPTVTFAEPGEWQPRPHRIVMGDSACSSVFSEIEWHSYGPRRARASGVGLFPDSGSKGGCHRHQKSVRLLLSRPRYCPDLLSFTRIAWRARSEHGYYVTRCQ